MCWLTFFSCHQPMSCYASELFHAYGMFHLAPITSMAGEAANGVANDQSTFNFLQSVDAFGLTTSKLYGVGPTVPLVSEATTAVAAATAPAATHYPSIHAIIACRRMKGQ